MKKQVKEVIKATLGAAAFNALPRKEKRAIVRNIERNLTAKAKSETVNYIDAINSHMGVLKRPTKTKTVQALVTVIKDGGADTKSALQRLDDKLAEIIDPETLEEEVQFAE